MNAQGRGLAFPHRRVEEMGWEKGDASLFWEYHDPQSGATWSGRGLAPKWLTEKEKAGAKREEFLIEAAPAQATKGKARG